MSAPTQTYTLRVQITKIETGTGVIQHEIDLKSHNLSLDETIAMQEELAPALLGWVKKDEP